MPPHSEIERKFLVDQPPSGFRRKRSVPIVQGYFPAIRSDLEIRLRRIGREQVITLKSGQGRSRREQEYRISDPLFRALWPLTSDARVAKRRYRLPWRGMTIEMDVYQGSLRGLITAEIEFESKRESATIQLPPWFGREVTDDPKYRNAALAQVSGRRRKKE